MAFGYKVPTFHLWGRLFKISFNDVDGFSWSMPQYFPCQFRHEPNTFRNSLAVPYGSYFRPIGQTPRGIGDIVQVGGNEYMWFRVISVLDIGAGFPNAYRQISLVDPQDESDNGELGYFWPSVNTAVVPPVDAFYLPIVGVADDWADPANVPPLP